jgi:cytochrome c oxidase subunit 4
MSAPPSAARLILTWILLLLLLALTLGSSYIPLSGLNGVVNLVIGAAKTVLVLMVFMHLRGAAPILKVIAAAGFVWLLILLGLGLADFAVRGVS